MSYKTRRELLIQIVPRYRESDRVQKRSILDEFVASTGYSRKYAIRLLSWKQLPVLKEIKRPRPRYYGPEELETLKLAWSAANFISSKRLAPFLKELIPSLERHGHLGNSDSVRTLFTRHRNNFLISVGETSPPLSIVSSLVQRDDVLMQSR